MRIVCAHLQNDYSGSPAVLANAIKGWISRGWQVKLFSGGKDGFLSNLQGVNYKTVPYKRSSFRPLTLVTYLLSQLVLFLRTLFAARKADVIYVNTLLPFGAALAGKLTGTRVIYHLHEVALSPVLLHKFLVGMAGFTASEVIYVSEYIHQAVPMTKVASTVLHNSIDPDFAEQAGMTPSQKTMEFTALMICSLRDYKGVHEFVALAERLPELRFRLVSPESRADMIRFFEGKKLPFNLELNCGKDDVHAFYASSHIVLNLSRPDGWIESFGMTLIEAMHYGLPVIGPTIGGPVELIREGENGYSIDCYEQEKLAATLTELASNPLKYDQLKRAALESAKQFDGEQYSEKIARIVQPIVPIHGRVTASGQSSQAETSEKLRLAFIGTAGIPCRYGGFETLAEELTARAGSKFELHVYCSGKLYPKAERKKEVNGAKLYYIPMQANGWQSIPYDIISAVHAMFRADTLVFFGVSGAIVLPLLRFFSKKKIIVHLDGMEWKRGKWSRWIRSFLQLSESIAVRTADAVIADNESIRHYVRIAYGKRADLIEYGADHALKAKPSPDDYERYPFLAKPYCFALGRIVPENNVELVLQAFSNQPMRKLVYIGNWEGSDFGKEMRSTFGSFGNIELLDPIYDPHELAKIRSNCALYIHGHSAGGTNPSLVEAMYLGLPIASYDVTYNRHTTENGAVYFASEEDIKEILQLPHERIRVTGEVMEEIAHRRYVWDIIAKGYSFLFNRVNDVKPEFTNKSKVAVSEQSAG